MAARADESALVDAWHGARIGHRRRQALLDAQRRSYSEIDVGEPRPPRVVGGLLLASLFTTLVEFQQYGTNPTVRELDAAGASSAIALARGDWWSIITANLLHAGVQHFVLNAFIIFLVGRWVEHVVGRWATVAVITVGALGTTAGSLIEAPQTVTIGASGIAFALLGCGLVVDPRGRTGLGVIVRPLAIFNVIATFLIPGVSIGGHLGGLVAGLLVGCIVWQRAESGSRESIGSVRRTAARALAIAGSAVLIGFAVWHVVAPTSARTVGTEVALRLIES